MLKCNITANKYLWLELRNSFSDILYKHQKRVDTSSTYRYSVGKGWRFCALGKSLESGGSKNVENVFSPISKNRYHSIQAHNADNNSKINATVLFAVKRITRQNRSDLLHDENFKVVLHGCREILAYQWSYKSRHLPSAMFRQNMSDVTQKWQRRKKWTLWKARRLMPQYKAESSATRQQVFINIHTRATSPSSLVLFCCMSQSRKMINHSFPCNIKYVIITSESIRSSPGILLLFLWISQYIAAETLKEE
jgi:hypothetical protein